ncbi:kinase-like domain-containing protein [Rhizophagus clarus]|uniref:Kinase-like domain-containing protein n=1 Tax=Rhizophagus clarus TaxID=94130 RepID=A0A8H3QY65_9GLOM|nr:kinase-like domain-containing protein [Rhizophagus clarus]
MEQLTNHKHKSDILLSGKNITITLSQPEQNTEKLFKNKKCNKCKRERTCDENEKICHTCFKIKTMLKSSGNKVIDDFIIYTQINNDSRRGKLEFVPYEQFKNIKFIARGGFSKIYKATWVDGPIKNWDDIKHKDRNIIRDKNYTVVLKELNKSDNITSEELNELKIFYQIYSDDSANNVLNKTFISKYFGITQDPDTKDIMIIMRYYSSAPEIFLERKYSEASDIYSFGMIMWEFMTECWHSDPEKRPTAAEINTRIWKMRKIEKENFKNNNPTKIIKSPDIGPVTVENNSGAIYKSRSLSLIIQSAISSRSLSVISSSSSRSQSAISLKSSRSRSTIFSRSSRSQSTNFEADKRKSKGNLLVVEGSNRNGYFTKEIEFDINISSNQPSNNEYVTKEIDLDINVL